MRICSPGDLVTLSKPEKLNAFRPRDWVGIIISIEQGSGFNFEPTGEEIPLYCFVAWNGRSPVKEFLHHLEVLERVQN
jgi:hypothetical protein